MDSNCPFCAVDKEKNRILLETHSVIVILSNPRLMPGHTLVIPRRHVAAWTDLAAFAREELLETAIRFQGKLKRLHPGGGCDLSQHDRPFMPTTKLTIPRHMHIHLRPRTWCDEFYEKVSKHETDVFQDLTQEEKEKFQKLLAE